MKLSIIIPVFNERESLHPLLERVRQVKLPKQIIVVDDGSDDGTEELLAQMAGDEILLLRHERNRGKGMAIRTALPHVVGDLVIIQDADLEYDPRDYRQLVEPIAKGECQVVYGSRNLQANRRGALPYYWGGIMLSIMANRLFGIHLTDLSTCYKVFRADLIKSLNLTCRRFEFCAEVTAKLARLGYEIREVPIGYCPRTKRQGKKLRLTDGVKAIVALLRVRFSGKRSTIRRT